MLFRSAGKIVAELAIEQQGVPSLSKRYEPFFAASCSPHRQQAFLCGIEFDFFAFLSKTVQLAAHDGAAAGIE